MQKYLSAITVRNKFSRYNLQYVETVLYHSTNPTSQACLFIAYREKV